MPLNWEWRFNELFNRYYLNTLDGIGADTVGFLGIGNDFGGGFPPGFQEIALSITIGPIPAAYDGKTICLDSSWFGTSTPWQWVKSDGYPLYPDWDGPHCFYISNSIEYSGQLFYQDIRPPDTNLVPMRQVVVEWWEDGLFFDTKLHSGVTSETGELPFFHQSFDHAPDLYFKIKASNFAADVSMTAGASPFEIITPTIVNHPPGVFDTTIIATIPESPYFFVADRVLYSHNRWTTEFGGAAPVSVPIDLEPRYYTSHYDPNTGNIHIEGATDISSFWPDVWDVGVIDHEFAHAIQYYAGFLDNGGGEHAWTEQSGKLVAGSEGFANFFANLMASSAIRESYGPSFSDTIWYNSENGETGVNGVVTYSANNLTTACEAAVAGIFWDIYDSADDDYSTDSTVYGLQNLLNPDGIGDTLSLGHDEIIEVLHLREVGGSLPDYMGEFRAAWFQYPSFGHHQAMTDIWYEHGELVFCCIGQTGDINGDGTDADPLDLSFLQDILYSGGPAAPCVEETDMDGDGSGGTVIDLAILVDYLFAGGVAPVQCP